MIGADAIINLQTAQRFKGPMPWRITSPTGDGQAIKVLPESPKLNCLQIGGQLSDPSGSIVSYSTESSISVAPETAPRIESNPNGIGSSEPEAPREMEVDLYKELLKLDDLRQRGILTDDEFQAEKKKLLDKY